MCLSTYINTISDLCKNICIFCFRHTPIYSHIIYVLKDLILLFIRQSSKWSLNVRCEIIFVVWQNNFILIGYQLPLFFLFISSSILQIILQHSRLQYIRFRFIKCTVTGKEAFNNFREKNRNAEMTILHHGSWLLCNYCLICDSEIEIVVIFFAS